MKVLAIRRFRLARYLYNTPLQDAFHKSERGTWISSGLGHKRNLQSGGRHPESSIIQSPWTPRPFTSPNHSPCQMSFRRTLPLSSEVHLHEHQRRSWRSPDIDHLVVNCGVPRKYPRATRYTLVTVDARGRADARVLNIMDIDGEGRIAIATSVRSAKERQLSANPNVALSWYCTAHALAIRIQGIA
jgi:hypothetical protein